MYVAGWSQGDRNSYLSATDFYYGTSCFSHYKRAFWWRLKLKLIVGAALVEEGGYQFWGGRVRFSYS